MKLLQKIAFVSGVLPVGVRYRQAFADCKTTRDKETKLMEMLRAAGMQGTAAAAVAIVTAL